MAMMAGVAHTTVPATVPERRRNWRRSILVCFSRVFSVWVTGGCVLSPSGSWAVERPSFPMLFSRFFCAFCVDVLSSGALEYCHEVAKLFVCGGRGGETPVCVG